MIYSTFTYVSCSSWRFLPPHIEYIKLAGLKHHVIFNICVYNRTRYLSPYILVILILKLTYLLKFTY